MDSEKALLDFGDILFGQVKCLITSRGLFDTRNDTFDLNEVNEVNIGAWVLLPSSLLGSYTVCPRCGLQVSSVSNYCNFCGALLRPELVLKICPNCKNRIPTVARFCNQCGQKQKKSRNNALLAF